MKVVTFHRDGQERLGFINGNEIIDALAAVGGVAADRAHFTDCFAFIRGGADARRAADALIKGAGAAARLPLAGARLAAPITPTTMLCSGSNYRDHNKEKANTPISGKEPEFFVKTADCVIGPDENIIHDERFCRKLDAETAHEVVDWTSVAVRSPGSPSAAEVTGRPDSDRMTARSTVFWSSRTFPGHR